jgi:alkylation response protein AidB-like acyl-CoA dehydrogenase
MDFAFDEQQLEFRAQLRTFFERECTASDVRFAFGAGAEEVSMKARARWGHLAQMGVVGILAPESVGGLGLGMVDLVGLLEESGIAGLPEPLAETAAMVVPLLAEVRGDDARRWLQRIVEGDAIAAIGLRGEPLVWGNGADLLLVASPEAVIACAREQGVSVDSVDASRRCATVTVDDVATSTLVEGPEAAVQFKRLQMRGALASSAVLLGAADRLIAFARDHALERKQFGKQIGSFQAVKHLLANAFVKLEMARPVVYAAAWAVDESIDEAGIGCSAAKATSSEAALEAARVALQIHGAMGYTWEHDLHLWMKRVWVVADSWGDASSHLASILGSLSEQRD